MGKRSAPTIAAIVTAAQSGDRDALSTLHNRFAPVVHGILLARVPPADADDLVQEVFLQALRTLIKLRDAHAFGPWIAAIARTSAARFHRRRRRHAPLPDELPADDAVDPARNGQVVSDAHRVLRAIQELPAAYRETLVLRLVQRLSGPDIAERTGLTEGSVRVNLHRGMALLRQRIGAPGLPGAPGPGATGAGAPAPKEPRR